MGAQSMRTSSEREAQHSTICSGDLSKSSIEYKTSVPTII
jgi:hypothetical protein